mgnify:CR=1 FL=1
MILFVNISVPLLLKFRKVFEDLKSVLAALFRMELAGKYIVLLDRSMDRCAVLSHCLHDLRIFCLEIIGMYKIYMGIFRDILKQSSVILKVQGIPSHVRDLESRRWRNTQDLAFKDPKSFYTRCLFAAFK